MQLRTVCINQRGEDVLTGEAVVMPSWTPVPTKAGGAASLRSASWTLAPWAWAAQAAAVWMTWVSRRLTGGGAQAKLTGPPRAHVPARLVATNAGC